MSEEKKQQEIPNQHLADKIAGKIDEQGNKVSSEEVTELAGHKLETSDEDLPEESE